jgi:hypothetical protein
MAIQACACWKSCAADGAVQHATRGPLAKRETPVGGAVQTLPEAARSGRILAIWDKSHRPPQAHPETGGEPARRRLLNRLGLAG